MKKLDRREKYFMKYVERIAAKYFRHYKNFYLSNAVDEEDLKQEVKIQTLKMLRGYKKKTPILKLKRIVAKYAELRIYKIRKLFKHKIRNNIKVLHLDSNSNFVDNILQSKRSSFKKPNLFFFELEQLCTPKEYEILYKMYKLRLNPTEIAKLLHITKAGVSFIHRKVLKKLKKYFTFR